MGHCGRHYVVSSIWQVGIYSGMSISSGQAQVVYDVIGISVPFKEQFQKRNFSQILNIIENVPENLEGRRRGLLS